MLTFFSPARAIAPGVLNVYVQAELPTRVAIGHQSPLLDCTDCPAVACGDPDLDQLLIRAKNETPARVLLEDSAVQEAVKRLMIGPEAGSAHPSLRELYLQPDRIWFRSHTRRMGEDQFQAILNDLLALAEATVE